MNSMCRTCMQKNKKLISILEYKEKGKKLSDILFECTAIRVQKSDAFPLCICCDCLERLIASWDFRGMVIKTDMKLQNIANRNDKENILQFSNKYIGMTIDKEETTVVKSEMYDLSEKENVDTSSSNYILHRHDTDEQRELNTTVHLESSANSNIIQSTKQNSEEKDNKSGILTSLMRKSDKSVGVLEKKGDEMLLEDNSQNNLDKHYTSTSENSIFLEISNEKEDDNLLLLNIKINNKKLVESKDKGTTALLTNTVKQNDLYFKEEKCRSIGGSQDSDSNDNKFSNLDIQDIKTEQQKNEVEDFHDENNLSESENEELDGILLTDNSQSYLDKIIDTLDSEDNDMKYLQLLAQSRYKKFTRKERRKMFVFCKICRKAFNYRNYTERHVFLHKSDRLMKCDICNKGFITKRELDSHKVVHSEDRSFTCKTCGKTFKRLNYLTKHEATHLDTKPLKCYICDRAYKRKELLKIHLQTHKSDTDYLCELCGKVFSSLTGLYGHKYVHVDQRKYSCSICGKTFSRALHRRQHMRKHSDERPYSCSYCDKCFKSKKVMVKHSLIHSDEKPYSCRICCKLFKHSASLYNHMRIHTGETPYPCKLCPSRFKYSHHLKNHMKSHN